KGLGGPLMNMRPMPRQVAAALLATMSLAAATGAMAAEGAAVSIHTLSSRPDMVSGGNALVEVLGATKDVKLTLNGHDVTSDLKLNPASHTLRGVVFGMTLGKNTLAA